MEPKTYPPLTAWRVTMNNGTSYLTSMAAGVTLEEARRYFIGSEQEQADEKTVLRVVKVEVEMEKVTIKGERWFPVRQMTQDFESILLSEGSYDYADAMRTYEASPPTYNRDHPLVRVARFTVTAQEECSEF